ncbi:MAG: hypothetical protein C0497_02535 [Gemmatimonas sp.]|nr:hypothetical protein [Gemmatimonas sp.]
MKRAHTGIFRLAGAALAACVAASAPVRAQRQPGDGVVARAARDELARTMAELRLEKADRPYFVAYTITETDGASASASFGSLIGSNRSRGRMLRVEVRVGDYTFDNTNFFSAPTLSGRGMRTFLGVASLPLDDDYLEIRRQIWLATDGAYKAAVEGIAGKRAALLNRSRTDSLADFSRADVTQTSDELPPVVFELAAGEALVRDLSRAGSSPSIYASSVSVSASNTRTYYINSEGTSFVRSRPMVTVTANASTQAADGMPLSNSLRVSARSMDAFPGRDQLAAQLRGMYATLDTIRNASVIDRYNGPVLFEGRAAAELFSEVFAPALAAVRKPVAGNAQSEMMASILGGSSSRGGSLADKLGARVLPEFLGVVDDPTLAEHANVPLHGGYTVDDQGVRARPTRLVQNGILKTLLSSRTPVEGVPNSSGNFRAGSVAPSNMIVEVAGGLGDAALRERLLAMAKARGLPFAIVVRALGTTASGDPSTMVAELLAASRPGGANRGRSVLRAYRVLADGREEVVRGAVLMGLGVDAFKGIVAASASATVWHGSGATGINAMLAAGGGGAAPSTFVVPALLFDDLTVTKRNDELPKPPFSVPPGAPQ